MIRLYSQLFVMVSNIAHLQSILKEVDCFLEADKISRNLVIVFQAQISKRSKRHDSSDQLGPQNSQVGLLPCPIRGLCIWYPGWTRYFDILVDLVLLLLLLCSSTVSAKYGYIEVQAKVRVSGWFLLVVYFGVFSSIPLGTLNFRLVSKVERNLCIDAYSEKKTTRYRLVNQLKVRGKKVFYSD